MSKLQTYLEAERQRLKGNLDDALRLYREALHGDPNDWKLRECVATVLHEKGELRDALRELFQAAHRLIWQGAYADATRLLQRMLRMDPDKAFDVTRGVQACLDEIAETMKESAEELPVEGDWGSTKEFLESLVLQDSSADYRVADEHLAAGAATAARRLTLRLGTRPPVAMQGKELLVGRSRDCHVVLTEGVVSRHHSRIVEMDGHFVLQNWESRNGTLLNGAAVDSAELHHGDLVRFGHSGPEATVEIAETAAAP